MIHILYYIIKLMMEYLEIRPVLIVKQNAPNKLRFLIIVITDVFIFVLITAKIIDTVLI